MTEPSRSANRTNTGPRTTAPFLEGVGPPKGRSVWEKNRYRRPVLRLEHKGDENGHAPNDWHMIVYDDGTFEDRHHERHPWSIGYMALEHIEGGTLRDWVELKLADGWRFAVGRFKNEPRVYNPRPTCPCPGRDALENVIHDSWCRLHPSKERAS